MFNEILLRRRFLYYDPVLEECIPEENNIDSHSKTLVIGLNENIKSLGFILAPHLLAELSTLSSQYVADVGKKLINTLREFVGDDIEYHPMYPNFPEEVVVASDTILFFNALLHYVTDGEWKPYIDAEARETYDQEAKQYQIINKGEQQDVCQMINDLLTSKRSLSALDKKDLVDLLSDDTLMPIPPEIPFKETLALYGACVVETYKPERVVIGILSKYFNTPTDVLRLAIHMSGGDVSLAKNSKFKTFSRRERRILLSLLERSNLNEEDFKRHLGKFIRLGEKLHPSEPRMHNKYPIANVWFYTMRNHPEELHSFASLVDNEDNLIKKIELLKQRPGEFARRLDWLLRNPNLSFREENQIVKAFGECADKVSTPVLLQLLAHFNNRRTVMDEERVFFPKGNTQKAFLKTTEDDDSYIHGEILNSLRLTIMTAIYNRLSDLPSWKGKKIYIDPIFSDIALPMSQRSASDTFKQLTRGSSFSIVTEEINIIRPFIWWTNLKDGTRVDIDLSAGLFDKDFKMIDFCSYESLKTNGCVHSGDLVNGGDYDGKGVAEFIDINLDELRTNDEIRYVVFTVHGYTPLSFNKMDHARFGWMYVDDANKGEIFEPSRVENKFNLTQDARIVIPMVLDVVTGVITWCDLTAPITVIHYNAISQTSQQIAYAIKGILNSHPTTMWELINLNIGARDGELVECRDEADLIFDTDTVKPLDEYGKVKDVDIITPWMTEYFTSQLM